MHFAGMVYSGCFHAVLLLAASVYKKLDFKHVVCLKQLNMPLKIFCKSILHILLKILYMAFSHFEINFSHIFSSHLLPKPSSSHTAVRWSRLINK
jgi:hypothetical protein